MESFIDYLKGVVTQAEDRERLFLEVACLARVRPALPRARPQAALRDRVLSHRGDHQVECGCRGRVVDRARRELDETARAAELLARGEAREDGLDGF